MVVESPDYWFILGFGGVMNVLIRPLPLALE